MQYQSRQILTVVVLLGMAVLMGLVIGLFDQGITGAQIFDGAACQENVDCDDGIAGTHDSCKNPGQENSFCDNTPITWCLNSDDVCPRGCTTSNDNDC